MSGCPQKLQPGQVRRYMKGGPLVGYMISCPACGFIALHMHRDAEFVELEGLLIAATNPLACSGCARRLYVAGGILHAVGT